MGKGGDTIESNYTSLWRTFEGFQVKRRFHGMTEFQLFTANLSDLAAHSIEAKMDIRALKAFVKQKGAMLTDEQWKEVRKIRAALNKMEAMFNGRHNS